MTDETPTCLHCALMNAFEQWREEHGDVAPHTETVMYEADQEISGIGCFVAEVFGQSSLAMPDGHFTDLVDSFTKQLKRAAADYRAKAMKERQDAGESVARH